VHAGDGHGEEQGLRIVSVARIVVAYPVPVGLEGLATGRTFLLFPA
jgi:hypothetical protein